MSWLDGIDHGLLSPCCICNMRLDIGWWLFFSDASKIFDCIPLNYCLLRFSAASNAFAMSSDWRFWGGFGAVMDARSAEIVDWGCGGDAAAADWDEDCAPGDPALVGAASFANSNLMSSMLLLVGCGSGFLPISASTMELLDLGSGFPPRIAARLRGCGTWGSLGSAGLSIPNNANTSGGVGVAIPGF